MSSSYTHYSDISVKGKVTSLKQGTLVGTVSVEPGTSGGLSAADCNGITVLYNGTFYTSDGTTWTAQEIGGVGTQSDWEEDDSADPAYIKNKPTIPTVPDISVVDNGTGTYVTDVTASGHTVTLSRGSVTIPDVTIADGSVVTGNVITALEVDSTDKHKIKVTKGITALTSETSLSKGTDSGSGNVVTDISVNGHQITLTKGITALTEHQSLAAYAPLASPALTGTPTAPTAASGTNTTQIATTAFVKSAIDGIPTPMRFMGTVGTGGTEASLPTASSSNNGYVYKAISDGSSPVAYKTGDTLVSNGTAWIVIPSGDEPAGTVTNVATGAGLTGGPITSSGTISLDTSGATAGSYGPSSDDSPGYAGTFKVPYITVDAYGRATAVADKTITLPSSELSGKTISTTAPSSTSDDTTIPTSAAVYSAINNVLVTIFGGSY